MAFKSLIPLVLIISGVSFFAASIYITVEASSLPAALLAAGVGYLLVSLGVEAYKEECRKSSA
jgi:ATP/ADP translocase